MSEQPKSQWLDSFRLLYGTWKEVKPGIFKKISDEHTWGWKPKRTLIGNVEWTS